MRSNYLFAIGVFFLLSGCVEEEIRLDTIAKDTETGEEPSCNGEMNDAGECIEGTQDNGTDENDSRDDYDRYDREGSDGRPFDGRECAWLMDELQRCIDEFGEDYPLCVRRAEEYAACKDLDE